MPYVTEAIKLILPYKQIITTMPILKKDKITPLVSALKQAQEAADQFKDTYDGGSANLDSVTIKLKHWTEDSIVEVSKRSGISISRKMGSSLWKNDRWISFETHGVRACNTVACEAACKVLEEKGYDVSVFYKMD